MNRIQNGSLVMSIIAMLVLVGCGSTEKSSSPAPTPGDTHTMPAGKKMNDQDMKK